MDKVASYSSSICKVYIFGGDFKLLVLAPEIHFLFLLENQFNAAYL